MKCVQIFYVELHSTNLTADVKGEQNKLIPVHSKTMNQKMSASRWTIIINICANCFGKNNKFYQKVIIHVRKLVNQFSHYIFIGLSVSNDVWKRNLISLGQRRTRVVAPPPCSTIRNRQWFECIRRCLLTNGPGVRYRLVPMKKTKQFTECECVCSYCK